MSYYLIYCAKKIIIIKKWPKMAKFVKKIKNGQIFFSMAKLSENGQINGQICENGQIFFLWPTSLKNGQIFEIWP